MSRTVFTHEFSCYLKLSDSFALHSDRIYIALNCLPEWFSKKNILEHFNPTNIQDALLMLISLTCTCLNISQIFSLHFSKCLNILAVGTGGEPISSETTTCESSRLKTP